MPTCQARTIPDCRGFTLIELLLVIAVVAITLGMLTLTLDPSSREDETADIRHTMTGEIDRIRRSARLEQATYGLTLHESGWVLYRIAQSPEEDSEPLPLDEWALPGPYRLRLERDGLPLPLRTRPITAFAVEELHLIFAPDGTSSGPWNLSLVTDSGRIVATLVSDGLNPPFWQKRSGADND